jgi:hypothetical protein
MIGAHRTVKYAWEVWSELLDKEKLNSWGTQEWCTWYGEAVWSDQGKLTDWNTQDGDLTYTGGLWLELLDQGKLNSWGTQEWCTYVGAVSLDQGN